MQSSVPNSGGADHILDTPGKLIEYIVDLPGHDKRFVLSLEKVEIRDGGPLINKYGEPIRKNIKQYQEKVYKYTTMRLGGKDE